jgi:hypothetical protein
MNQCAFKHSARNLPLNDSMKALSVGFPGREKSRVTQLQPGCWHRTLQALPQSAQQDATDALVAELRAQLAEMRAQHDACQGIPALK